MKLGKHFKACVASAWSAYVPGQALSGHPNGSNVQEVCVCIPAPASMKLGKHFKACFASAWSVQKRGQVSGGHQNGIHVLEVRE